MWEVSLPLHARLLPKYPHLWVKYFQHEWLRREWWWGGGGGAEECIIYIYIFFFQSKMYYLMESTQISSLLCRWRRLAVSEVENITNISWDRKPLMMKCSPRGNPWMQRSRGESGHGWEHTRWYGGGVGCVCVCVCGGGLAERLLAESPLHVNGQIHRK